MSWVKVKDASLRDILVQSSVVAEVETQASIATAQQWNGVK